MNKTTQQIEQTGLRKLETYVSDYLIFVDTNVFLHSDYERFMRHAMPLLQKHNASIIVPRCVVNELGRVGKRKPERRDAADKALKNIATYNKAGVMRVLGSDQDDRVADNVFLSKFTDLRLKRNLLLITNDMDLAANIEGLGVCSSLRNVKSVRAQRINRHGFLQSMGRSHSASCSSSVPTSAMPKPQCAAFAVGRGSVNGSCTQLPVTGSVAEGSTLSARVGNGKRAVKLGAHVAAGGEGDIYEVSGTQVAKIYMPSAVTTHKRDKLSLLLAHGVALPGVCFPTAMLYNERDEFVGYLMPRAKGHVLRHLLNNRAYLQQHFPNWKKRDMVQLCLTVLQLFHRLHELNVIIGDINLDNILVESPSKVHFVDTDSYQVENYPCPVGTAHFTAPEIQGCRYPEFLRTEGHERFAVATLLFMMMMMGKAPYAMQGGGDLTENIRRGEFSYPMGNVTNRLAPQGDWRFLWSHLSKPIKQAFFDTFHRDGAHRAENARLDDKMWLRLFGNYLHGLDHGMLDRDAMSGELFPTRHKRSDMVEQTICRRCGAKVPAYESRGGLCHDCVQKAAAHAQARQQPAQASAPRPHITQPTPTPVVTPTPAPTLVPSAAPQQQQPKGLWEKACDWLSDFFS